jgi:hypothetical protein
MPGFHLFLVADLSQVENIDEDLRLVLGELEQRRPADAPPVSRACRALPAACCAVLFAAQEACLPCHRCASSNCIYAADYG